MQANVSGAALSELFSAVLPGLNERQRRLFAGATSSVLGYGGDSAVARVAGLSRNTVAAGRKEWEKLEGEIGERVRRPGAGRRAENTSSQLNDQLASLLHPGGPRSGRTLDWTLWSTYELAAALGRQGVEVSPRSIGQLLRAQGYQLNGPGRLVGRRRRQEMQAQLSAVAKLTEGFLARGMPVVEVAVRSLPEPGDTQPALQGLENQPALAALSTEAVRKWWLAAGRARFPASDRILICSAIFGADDTKLEAWEHALTQLADQIDIELTTLHVPAVTRRWNRAETQLAELISIHDGCQGVARFEITVAVVTRAGDVGPSSCAPDGFDGLLPAGKIRRGLCFRVAPMGDDHLAPAGSTVALNRTTSSRGSAQRLPGTSEPARPPIPRTAKLAETLAREIVRDISAKHLRPGSRLQDVRSVKNRYHVSNSSVRESLRMLEMLGVLSVKPGPQGGTVVRQVTTEDFALATTFYYHILDVRVSDLIDARVALEPILVRFAAKQQSPAVMKRLRWYLTGVGQEDAFATPWHTRRSPTASFHRALVETGNPMLDMMVHSLQECWLDMRRGFSFPRDVSHHDRDHVRIAEAILSGKEAEAEHLMQRHMDYVATFANMHFSELMEKVIDWP